MNMEIVRKLQIKTKLIKMRMNKFSKHNKRAGKIRKIVIILPKANRNELNLKRKCLKFLIKILVKKKKKKVDP